MTAKRGSCPGTTALRRYQSGRLPLLLMTCLVLSGMSGSAVPALAQSSGLAELSSQGKIALRDQQFERAESIYEEIIKLDPRSAEAHSNLGLARYMGGKYPPAITEFQKALALDPHLDHTKILLALSYFDSGD